MNSLLKLFVTDRPNEVDNGEFSDSDYAFVILLYLTFLFYATAEVVYSERTRLGPAGFSGVAAVHTLTIFGIALFYEFAKSIIFRRSFSPAKFHATCRIMFASLLLSAALVAFYFLFSDDKEWIFIQFENTFLEFSPEKERWSLTSISVVTTIFSLISLFPIFLSFFRRYNLDAIIFSYFFCLISLPLMMYTGSGLK
ncbi:MAG TPA: hypothetical protein VIN77_12420 [Aurantimonas sp.]